MKRMIRNATNSCGMAAKPVTADYDDFAYEVDYDDTEDGYEYITSKDILDADGFRTEYTMYRDLSDGHYVFMFGDRDIYKPGLDPSDWECDTEEEAWEWFDSYEGFPDDDDESWRDVDTATDIYANREDRYFGEIASKKYGDMICEKLGEGFKISKRRDRGEQPGGLVYEAQQLGIDMWDLLEALEGMCADGRAREIDDSTYEIIGGEPQEVETFF